MPSESLSPKLTAATGLAVEDDRITWTAGGNEDHIKIQEVTLVIQGVSKENTTVYIIGSLIENTDDNNNPFELKLLATDAIPPQLQQYLITELPRYLRHGPHTEVDVVVSIKSGTGHSLKFWQDVLQPLWALVADRNAEASGARQAGLARVLVTENENSVRTFARELWAAEQRDGPDASHARTVVLLSGDGGVVDLLNGCEDLETRPSRVAIAVLPLGTGNALFNSTHKPLYADSGPSPLVAGLRSLFKGTSADLPVFRASFSDGARMVAFKDKDKKEAGGSDQDLHLARQETAVSHLYGAIVASYGFHASIVYESDTPEHRVHGDKRFGMVAQELLRESHAYRAVVSYSAPDAPSDFKTVDRESHAYALTTLVSNLERTFTISPAGKPLDGQLRLVHFGPVGGERTLDVMMKAYDGGKHVGTKWDDGHEVGYEAVGAAKVVAQDEDSRWRKVCIDGTIVELPFQGHVTIATLQKSPVRLVVNPTVLVK